MLSSTAPVSLAGQNGEESRDMTGVLRVQTRHTGVGTAMPCRPRPYLGRRQQAGVKPMGTRFHCLL